MKYLYPAITALLLSACAAQPPAPVRIDTEKYPLDTEAAGIDTFIRKDAREIYQQYSKMNNHKAFAQSRSGAWGWWADSNSAEYAMLDALYQCRKRNAADEVEMPCMIVNLNGYWGAGLF